MLSPEETQQYEDLRTVVARLRAADGCPWDREQTHASLRPFVIEEAFEVVGALDENDLESLPEELGDLLFQVLLHTQLAEEAGEFTMTEVMRGLADKLVRRHPHVFGDRTLETADEVNRQWDELKRSERQASQQSALSGVPRALPALSYAQTLLGRAEKAGFAWPDRRDVLAKIEEELEELASAASKEEKKAEFGDLLLNLANYARYLEIDAEEALREAGHKFRRRFDRVESAALEASKDLRDISRDELMGLWQQSKAAEQPGNSPAL
jgi:tetrapyrrole methylase family protein/MazG family protein